MFGQNYIMSLKENVCRFFKDRDEEEDVDDDE